MPVYTLIFLFWNSVLKQKRTSINASVDLKEFTQIFFFIQYVDDTFSSVEHLAETVVLGDSNNANQSLESKKHIQAEGDSILAVDVVRKLPFEQNKQ